MEQNNSASRNTFKAKIGVMCKKAEAVFARWFFLLSFLAAAFFCVWIWYGYVWKAEWNEEKKQRYISEQAKFSFDKNGYQKMIEMMQNRKYKFEHSSPFAGRDVFFPEGFQ